MSDAMTDDGFEAVRVINPGGTSPYVLTCDHASNFMPGRFGSLGLDESELSRHIAWDPGAADVARLMASALDACLVESRVSRLVIDCNRPLDAPDLVPALSETTIIPGNQSIAAEERDLRVERVWRPFHEAIDEQVRDRIGKGRETRLVSVHSYTPVYKGVPRPWHVGILHDDDTRLSSPLLEALRAVDGLVVGDNQPYAPADRVYFTLERHARSRGLPCAMIEIRNDVIEDHERWSSLLASLLARIRVAG